MKNLSEYASGNFLKAINVQSEKEEFMIDLVEEIESQYKKETVLRLTLKNPEGAEFNFDLNKTNAKFLVTKGYDKNPLLLVGHKLSFKKVLVRNPNTNREEEGLRISDIK